MAKIKQGITILAMDLSLSGSAFAVLEVCTKTVKIVDLIYVNNDLPVIKGQTHREKLGNIHFNLEGILTKYSNINILVREKGFSRFPAATQALFKVVGAVDLTLYFNSITLPMEEIAPTSVKKIVTGSGKASKQDVDKAVRNYLSAGCRDIVFETDNHSDAVAVGVAYCRKHKLIPEFSWSKEK